MESKDPISIQEDHMGEGLFPHAHFEAYQNAFRMLQAVVEKYAVDLQLCNASLRNVEESRLMQLVEESDEQIVVSDREAARLYLRHPAPEHPAHFPGLALGAYPVKRNKPSNWVWYIEFKFGSTDEETPPTWQVDLRYDVRYPQHTRPDLGEIEDDPKNLSQETALQQADDLVRFYTKL